MNIKFLGITIEKKTDILAFAAFVISIGGLLAQATILLRGSDVQLQAVSQVMIYKDSRSDTEHYVNFVGSYFYFNNGSPGYSDVIREERAVLKLGDRAFEFRGIEHGSSSAPVTKNETEVWTKTSDFTPTEVASGKVVFRETRLVPFNSRTELETGFLQWPDFLAELETHKTFSLVQISQLINDGELRVSCHFKTKEFLYALKDKGWSAPICRPGQPEI